VTIPRPQTTPRPATAPDPRTAVAARDNGTDGCDKCRTWERLKLPDATLVADKRTKRAKGGE
jgi:hypothetical protein